MIHKTSIGNNFFVLKNIDMGKRNIANSSQCGGNRNKAKEQPFFYSNVAYHIVKPIHFSDIRAANL